VYTLFIGGGTPSLFPAESIDRLLGAVRARLPLDAAAEVTLEANPGTFERGKFRAFRDAGITRLSVGVQSFDTAALKALGRVHDADEARAAVEGALALFDRVNVDLMYALPGQSPEQALADVSTALGLGARHVSAYQLTLEPNTVFHRYPPVLPDEDGAELIEQAVHGRLAEAGLERYEVSAFAAAGHRARHNLNYWTFGDYLGVGAGAHGKVSFPDRIERTARFRHPRRFMEAALAGDAVETRHTLDADELPFEFLLNALRLVDGVPAGLFAERTGRPLAEVARPIAEAVRRGLLDPDPATIRPTPLGLRFLNDLQQLFLA
jgi:oxygen-independent coproporphyrinogen-3 oxidase